MRHSLLTLVVGLLAACSYDNGSSYRYVDQSQTTPVYSAGIDADAKLENVAPGEGVGMMIEYSSGGTWRVQFTCDTAKTNLQCYWGIDVLSLDASPIGGIDEQNLDSFDSITRQSPDVFYFDGLTTTELDAFTFQADAGKPVGFHVWLQDEPEPYRYVFWISDGWLNRGISGPDFDLYPNTP